MLAYIYIQTYLLVCFFKSIYVRVGCTVYPCLRICVLGFVNDRLLVGVTVCVFV